MTQSNIVDVLVVGAGAAGMMAARGAALAGASVVLLEKNERPGMKILISGGGKCNLTHAGPMEEIHRCFRPNEARFLKPAFHRYTNSDFLTLVSDYGMQTYSRPDGRIFPVEPTNAKDVVSLLMAAVRDAGVVLRTGTPVDGLHIESGRAAGVLAGDTIIRSKTTILAAGGSSYPATGTTGDAWRWLTPANGPSSHTLVPLRAALAPLYLATARPDWSGVALRDIVLRARTAAGGREFARWAGDLLFTHKGVSGPAALGIAREVAERIAESPVALPVLEVDLLPAQDFEEVRCALQGEGEANPRKTVGAMVSSIVPSRLVEPVLAAAGFATDARMRGTAQKSLNRLASTLKGWSLGEVRQAPLERGEVVAGGISLEEVDPQTMASRRLVNLFLCGELLDIAGPVGGYNLQAAWSTGHVAGESAAHTCRTLKSPDIVLHSR